MPKPIPYFTCKRITPSLLSLESMNDSFEWYKTSAEELNVATEISGIFIGELLWPRITNNKLTKISDIPKFLHKSYFWGKPLLKISIESLQELDNERFSYLVTDKEQIPY